jgi:hypothetical protein
VEHPCYQCGAAVEDGIPFCPKCSAPQIRVAGPAIVAQATATAEPPLAEATSYRQPVHPAQVDWPQALTPALQAGFIAAILMIIPLGASFGLGMLAAGFLAVLLYRRRVPLANLRAGMGARLGAVSGAIGFGIFGILTAIETMVFHAGGELRAELLKAVEQAAARNSDPQAQQVLQYMKSPEGLAAVMVMGLVAMFFIFVIFSSLGGAVGAAMLHRKDRP